MKNTDTEIGTSYGHGPRQGVPYKPSNTMKTQFTPGPLKTMADPEFQGLHPYHDCRFIATADAEWDEDKTCLDKGCMIARMTDTEHQKGYATLLAAAPEMLAALQVAERALFDSLTPDNEPEQAGATAIVRAAIAKALGQ